MSLPRDEQLTLVDRPTANPSRRNASPLIGSRYSPQNAPVRSGAHFPDFVTHSDGRRWLRLRHDRGEFGGTSRQWYSWPHQSEPGFQQIDARPRKIALEFEFRISDCTSADFLNLWSLRASISGTATAILLCQGASLTEIRASRSGAIVGTPLAFQLRTDATYSARILAWASDPGAHNGRFVLYLAEGSITDRAIVGTGNLVWIRAVEITDIDSDTFDGFELCFNPAGPGITTGARPSLWTRCLWQGDPDATPTPPTSAAISWFDMHRNTIKRSGLEWRGSAWKLRSSCVVHDGVTPCRGQAISHLRLYQSLAAYEADEALDVALVKAIRAKLGCMKATAPITGLAPETPYVYEWRLLLRDQAYNGGAQYVVRGKPGFLFTPPAPGRMFSIPPFIEVSSCRSQDLEANCAKRHRGLEGWPDDRFRLLIEMGDDVGGGYMDEFKYQKSMDLDADGVHETTGAYEGAETPQHMADEAAMLAFSFHTLEESRFWLKDTIGDDHNRATNDTAMMNLLREDRLWAGNVQVCPWSKRGCSAPNSRYGYPNSIRWFVDGAEGLGYSCTPRRLGDTLLGHFREWCLDIAPAPGTGMRLDPSSIEKYPGVRFRRDDAGYYFKDYGCLRLIICDTRLSMVRDPAHGGPAFFNWAKPWVVNAIRTAPGPGVLLAIPGYVQGFATGAAHKRNDCIAAYIQDGNPAVEAEALEVFLDAMELAPLATWGVILVGDAHWASLDRTVGYSYSPKWIAQLHDGGAQSRAQDWREMGDVEGEEDYVYVTNFGISRGAIRTRTRYELLDGRTGRGRVTLWKIGEDQTVAHSVIIGD